MSSQAKPQRRGGHKLGLPPTYSSLPESGPINWAELITTLPEKQRRPNLLITPGSEKLGKLQPKLNPQRREKAERRFKRMRRHFDRLFDRVTQNQFLRGVLELTSKRSFMDQTLNRAAREAGFRNNMAEFLHGTHTGCTLISHTLPYVGIFIDHFTRTPIPENLQAIETARKSVGPLADIAKDHQEFYDEVRRGVRTPEIVGNTLKIEGLEIRVEGNGKTATPQLISSDATTIEVNGRLAYNGLPPDREQYPTYVMPEGTKLSMKINIPTAELWGIQCVM
ncbi:MAG: hypothetical protein ABH950_08340 [Candidatus Altiarchaeota archaeon]